jgi:hypothetical protein
MYYDEQKGKYFKIQADYKLPAGSKYAASSVAQSKRETKKRKREQRDQQARERETVRRSRVLQSPSSTAFALRQETGVQRPTRDLADRDAFFLANLRPTMYYIEPPPNDCRHGHLLDAIPNGLTDEGKYQERTCRIEYVG